MRIFIFFALHCFFFAFLYFLNSLLPHFLVAELLSSFFLQIVVTGHFDCRNKSFFTWSHQINFFPLQIVAAPAAPDHMYSQGVVQPHVTFRRPKNWPFIYFDQAESTDYVVQMMCMCIIVHEDMSAVREWQRGGTLVHIMCGMKHMNLTIK